MVDQQQQPREASLGEVESTRGPSALQSAVPCVPIPVPRGAVLPARGRRGQWWTHLC